MFWSKKKERFLDPDNKCRCRKETDREKMIPIFSAETHKIKFECKECYSGAPGTFEKYKLLSSGENLFKLVAEAISLNASLTRSYQRIKCAERNFAPCLGSECNRIATYHGEVIFWRALNK